MSNSTWFIYHCYRYCVYRYSEVLCWKWFEWNVGRKSNSTREFSFRWELFGKRSPNLYGSTDWTRIYFLVQSEHRELTKENTTLQFQGKLIGLSLQNSVLLIF